TLNSVSDVDFLRSQTPPLIPSSLDRVGLDRRKLFVLYTDIANNDFKEEEDTLGDIKVSIRRSLYAENFSFHLRTLGGAAYKLYYYIPTSILANSLTYPNISRSPLYKNNTPSVTKYYKGAIIIKRVLIITTDNVLNNQTLISSIYELVQSLGKIKAIPKNKTTDIVWSEARSQLVRVDIREFETLLSILIRALNAEKHSIITQPFFKFTTTLSKIKDVTIYLIFKIYNNLFEYLNSSIAQLQRKKLRDYYAKIEDIYGYLYTISTILTLDTKLQFFSSPKYNQDFSLYILEGELTKIPSPYKPRLRYSLNSYNRYRCRATF
ncbi:hypothetical protein N7524_010898, partial [Penicillium chrysogenum]